MRNSLTAAVVLTLLLAGAAQAAPPATVPQGWIDYGLAAAKEHFGADTCASVTVAYEEGEQGATVGPGPCGISLNPTVEWTASTVCSAVVHEYGHLLGLGHTDIPGDVMNPNDAYEAIPACIALMPPAPRIRTGPPFMPTIRGRARCCPCAVRAGRLKLKQLPLLRGHRAVRRQSRTFGCISVFPGKPDGDVNRQAE